MPEEKPKRTIDARIDAIAQSVALIAHMQRTNEAELEKLTAAVGKINESLLALLALAGNHERRLMRLEGRPDTQKSDHPGTLAWCGPISN